MKSVLKLSSLLWLIVPISLAQASFDVSKISYTVEPFVGYELNRLANPTRATLLFVYGARIIAGYRMISAEGEYTHGSGNEFLPASNETIQDTSNRYRLGLRSTYDFEKFLSVTARLGGEVLMLKTATTLNGATTTSTDPTQIHPYAGLGVEVHVTPSFSLNGEAVVTFRSLSDMQKNDLSTSVGVKIYVNTK